MKRSILVLLIVLLGILSGCGQNTEAESGGEETAEPVFEWTPYIWNELYEKAYGEEFHQNFDRYVHAALSCEQTFPCSSEEHTWMFSGFQNNACPLLSEIVEDITYRDGMATITYKYDEVTVRQKIEDFSKQIELLVTEAVQPEDSPAQKALLLFLSYISKASYDRSAAMPADLDQWYVYRGLTEYQGICQTFAGAYSYLCNQCGIEATVVYGTSSEGYDPHVWSLLRLDGAYYYMDPTYALHEDVGLSSYGMTTERRTELRGYGPEHYNLGNTNVFDGNDIQVNDARYSPLWDSTEITEIRREENSLLLVYLDQSGSEHMFSLD